MIKIDQYNIFISRGDTASLTITFTDNVPANGTTAIVSLKKALNSRETVWSKELTVTSGQVTWTISHDDTNLVPGKYVWDLRLSYANNDIYTPITPHEFNIVEVVGSVDED